MTSLKKQIHKVVVDLHHNDAIIRQQQQLLLKSISKGHFLIVGLLGCFVTGYLFARKKTLKQLLRASIYVPLRMRRHYRNIKFFFLVP
jgi:hypothetical protein